jgi:hypothetical protein
MYNTDVLFGIGAGGSLVNALYLKEDSVIFERFFVFSYVY